jgi:rubrerythrin
MRPVDGDRLLEAIEEERKYLRSRGLYGAEHILVHNFRNLVEDAQTIDLKDIYQEGHYDGHLEGYTKAINEERPQGEWGKWIVSEIQCPKCLEYFDTDCYSKEELNKCPNCGAKMDGGTECH